MTDRDRIAPPHPETTIAIVGLAYRFNGQSGPLENLSSALETGAPVQAMIPGAELFDPVIFGLDAASAAFLDPQHRIFLECALEALSDGGLQASPTASIGVYGACAPSRYFLDVVSSMRGPVELAKLRRGTDKDYLPAVVSQALKLTGPSFAVQSACASGIAAVHTACQALLGGECDAALAGAISIGHGWLDMDDDQARDLVDGCGVVLLKPFLQALDDGDQIHALILGSALGHGGAGDFPGLIDPRAARTVMLGALATAGVSSQAVGYVEIHGIGDSPAGRAEIETLEQIYGMEEGLHSACGFGSIKSAIGYPGVAGGMAGLLSALLTIRDGVMRSEIARRDMQAPYAAGPWPDVSAGRVAAVNAIGMTGSHAHLVLSQPPPDCDAALRPRRTAPRFDRVRLQLN